MIVSQKRKSVVEQRKSLSRENKGWFLLHVMRTRSKDFNVSLKKFSELFHGPDLPLLPIFTCVLVSKT